MTPRRHSASREPTLDEMLDDPIIQDIMDSDGVTRLQIKILFAALRHDRTARPPGFRRSDIFESVGVKRQDQ